LRNKPQPACSPIKQPKPKQALPPNPLEEDEIRGGHGNNQNKKTAGNEA